MTAKETFDIIIGVVTIGILSITAYFIYRAIYSPVDAVKIGRQLNQEQQKDNAKRNLFLMLFALRGSPLNYDFVRGLNQIDIVFEDCQPVLDAWHKLYDSLHLEGQINPDKTWETMRVDLLSAMAIHLGYSKIRQTDMIREYYPQGHSAQLQGDLDFRKAAVVYLQSGAAFHEFVIEQLGKTPEAQTEPLK